MGCARSRSRFGAALLAVIGVGLGLRLWGLDYGLPHPAARPDEEVLIARLLAFDAGDPNPHWFIYPTFYLYLTYAWVKAVLLGGRLLGMLAGPTELSALMAVDPGRVSLVARGLSALLGTATIALTYAVARAVADRRAALIAAVIVAVSFLHVRESHFFKPDAALGFFATLALLALVRLQRTGSARAAVAAGAACGLAFGVKYDVALGAALPCAVLLGPADGVAAPRWRRLLVAGITAAAVGIAASPFLVLDRRQLGAWLDELYFWFSHGGGGMASGFGYHLEYSFLAAQGLPFAVFAVAALVWQGARRRHAPLTAFVLASFVEFGVASAAYTRFVTPLLPALAVLAGVAVVRLGARVASPALRTAAMAVLVALLVARPLASAVAFDRVVGRPDTRLLARAWLEAHVT
ncbi:MAG TPA: glycosyltransferase family 39 protein, partial [Solirubrobacteraceae bacterium]